MNFLWNIENIITIMVSILRFHITNRHGNLTFLTTTTTTVAKLNCLNFCVHNSKTNRYIIHIWHFFHNSNLAKVQYLYNAASTIYDFIFWFFYTEFFISYLCNHPPKKSCWRQQKKQNFCFVRFYFQFIFIYVKGLLWKKIVLFQYTGGTKSLWYYKSNGNWVSKDERKELHKHKERMSKMNNKWSTLQTKCCQRETVM